jgi:hypothetical protein
MCYTILYKLFIGEINLSPRGGYRGKQAVRKSRKLDTTKITVYKTNRDQLNEISEQLNIPVVEFIYRVLNHKDFSNILNDIKSNITDNWHEQEI